MEIEQQRVAQAFASKSAEDQWEENFAAVMAFRDQEMRCVECGTQVGYARAFASGISAWTRNPRDVFCSKQCQHQRLVKARSRLKELKPKFGGDNLPLKQNTRWSS
jgi:hypothetical protein